MLLRLYSRKCVFIMIGMWGPNIDCVDILHEILSGRERPELDRTYLVRIHLFIGAISLDRLVTTGNSIDELLRFVNTS